MLREPFIKNPFFQEVKPMQLSLKHAESLKEHLSGIPDPRFRRGIRHRKLSVLTTALCAIICSANSFIAIAEWAGACTQSMLKRLGCRLNPKTHTRLRPTVHRSLLTACCLLLTSTPCVHYRGDFHKQVFNGPANQELKTIGLLEPADTGKYYAPNYRTCGPAL